MFILIAQAKEKVEVAYFAGGCFWGIEHTFQLAPGVITAESGYQQGKTVEPNYYQICDGDTEHAESVKVTFDPTKITFRQLVTGFFEMHDPTQVDGQGPDLGTQYRSGIWCETEEQLKVAQEILKETQARFEMPIATQVEMAKHFYPAEEYHQDYIVKTGQ